MLNIEYWKDRLKALHAGNRFIAVSNGIPELCGELECSKCDFLNTDCSSLYDWLCEEHKSEIDWDNDIDWTKVPVEADVFVKNAGLYNVWCARKFAVYVPNSRCKYRTFDDEGGQRTSFSLPAWVCCKLANPEDVEKYRRR